MSTPPGRPKAGSLPPGGTARSAKGAQVSTPPGRPKAGSALQAAPSRDATPLRSVHPRAGGDGAADLSPPGGTARSAKGARVIPSIHRLAGGGLCVAATIGVVLDTRGAVPLSC